jgi:hypothetical protein
MAKWRNGQNRFKVKVSYRKEKNTATIAIPPAILEVWAKPEYVLIFGEDGKAIVEPVSN